MNQVDVLHGAITARHIKHLNIISCEFANDGSLERILSACTCTNVERMTVNCNYISEYSALSRLLSDPATILQWLAVINRSPELNNEERHVD